MFSAASTLRLWLGLTVSGAAVAATRHASSLRPVPDFAPVKAVFLSEDLLAYDYHAPELINALAGAGAQVWIATAAPRGPRAFSLALTGC